MKKLPIILIAVILIAAIVFVGAKYLMPKGPKVTQPFTFDFKTDMKIAQQPADADSMAIMLCSTPFYAGAPLPEGQKTYEFDEVREKKVEEIIEISNTLAEDTLSLKKDVGDLREALMSYLDICYKNDPAAKTFALDATKELLRIWTLETLTETEFNSIKTDSDNDFTRSSMQYVKVTKAVQLAALYLQDIDTIGMCAAMGVDQLANSKNAKVAEAGKKLDSTMKSLNSLKKRIQSVHSGMAKVDYGFKQLATADYYYARTAVEFMRESMPDLKKTLGEAKPNEYLDEQTLEYTREYLTKFDKFSTDFQAYLDSVPQSRLLPVALLGDDAGCAWAGDAKPASYTTAYRAAKAPAQPPAQKSDEGWLAWGWEGIKKTVHGAQSVVGVGLDIAGTTVKNISRVGSGLYYGNSASEIWSDMKKNAEEINTNWKNNLSGSSTLNDAKGYLEYVDESAEYIASSGIEKVIGEGWTSWGVGKVAKAASSIFTGLGKGIYLVGNRDSNASDYAIGAIEIASSMIGGSKLIIKGSQLPGFLKGLAQGSWLSAKRSLNAVFGIFSKYDASQLKAAIKQGVKYGEKMYRHESELAITKAMLAALKQSNETIKAELKNLIKTGAASGWANFKGTMQDSLHDFAKKQFANNLKGLAEALGATGKDVIDNIMSQWAGDYIKEIVNEVMAEAPMAEEIAGKWSGTVVFSTINIEGDSEAAKKGCDIAGAIKALKGKALPSTLSLNKSNSNAGAATLKISVNKESDPLPANYVYSNGTLNVKGRVEHANVTINAKLVRTTQGYRLSGTISLTAPGMAMSGSIKMTKPR
ncbi:MAG: hypothetical protein GX139_02730 [Armatimonadetes bacterium]|nr:hypothetical protein [Armatimonadota bacterium]